MSISRYNFSPRLLNGKYYGSSYASSKIFRAVEDNEISTQNILLSEQQRLDQIAGIFYKNSSYWWIIAAASGIGWGLQVPPGTLIRIPTSLEQVMSVL